MYDYNRSEDCWLVPLTGGRITGLHKPEDRVRVGNCLVNALVSFNRGGDEKTIERYISYSWATISHLCQFIDPHSWQLSEATVFWALHPDYSITSNGERHPFTCTTPYPLTSYCNFHSKILRQMKSMRKGTFTSALLTLDTRSLSSLWNAFI